MINNLISEPQIKKIDLRLPLRTESGQPVFITHTFTNGEAAANATPFMYVGMIKESADSYQQERWDQYGNPRSGQSQHQLKNQAGLTCTEVYLNVYQDGSTGYGYLSKETAHKYARADGHAPVVAQVKKTIIYKSAQQ